MGGKGGGGSTVYISGGTIDRIGSLDSINSIKKVGGVINEAGWTSSVQPTDTCNWWAPRWGPTGQNAEATIFKAAAIAVAVYNTLAAWDIAQQRFNIAKEYARIAMDRWNRFRTAYMPKELSMLQEVTAPGYKYVANYPKARADYSGWFRNAYAETGTRFDRVAARYALRADPTFTRDLDTSGAISIDDGVNFGYRYEEWREVDMDDKRWNRRSNLLNLGRDIMAQSAAAAARADSALANQGHLMAQGGQGAMEALGYLVERRETQYPQGFATGVNAAGEGGFIGSLYNFTHGVTKPTKAREEAG